MPHGERLQKILARAGVGSRRACESLILEGRVSVNGVVVRELGTRADPATDRIEIDGEVISPEKKVYLVLHKPPGYVTTLKDPQGRPTVMHLLRDVRARVFPVGRLDYDSEGLLFMTNDGDLAHIMTHPSWGVDKTYLAYVRGVPGAADLSRLRAGVPVAGGISAPAKARIAGRHSGGAIVEITIHEGRKHQVKDMCAAVGHPVERLIRISFGPLRLGKLEMGSFRYLTGQEVKALMALLNKAKKARGNRAGNPPQDDPPGGNSEQGRPSQDSGPRNASVRLAPFEMALAVLAFAFGVLLVTSQLLLAVDSWRERLVPLERLEGIVPYRVEP
ncbi:MAG TPA: rRNA pseudouridine synthase [Firmicutes bacterium]|nr:rRNA pseudouridine synthase [Bacillota bacterium]